MTADTRSLDATSKYSPEFQAKILAGIAALEKQMDSLQALFSISSGRIRDARKEVDELSHAVTEVKKGLKAASAAATEEFVATLNANTALQARFVGTDADPTERNKESKAANAAATERLVATLNENTALQARFVGTDAERLTERQQENARREGRVI